MGIRSPDWSHLGWPKLSRALGLAGASLFGTQKPTIRTRIISLVSIILAPMLVLIAWLSWNYADAQRRDIELRRSEVAKNIVFITDREIASIRGSLLGLASSEDLVRGDLNEFKKHARAVANQPHFLAIRVLRANGEDAVSAVGSAADKPMDALNPALLAQVFAGQAVVSGLMGKSAPDVFYYVCVPVKRNDRVAYALAAAIDPDRLKGIFVEAGLDQQWIAAVVDAKGRFVARSLGQENFVGRQARPELIAVAGSADQHGEFENVTHEGMRARNSFSKSPATGWTAVVAVPSNILFAPIKTTVLIVGLGGILGALIVISIASLLAARISEPVRGLSTAAMALVEGRALPEFDYRIAELDEVRSALEYAVGKSSHFAAIIASSGDAIISTDLNGRVKSWNKGAEELFDYAAVEIIGKQKDLIIAEDRMAELAEQIEQIKRGQTIRLETQCRRKGGKIVDVSLNLAPIRGADGRIVAISSIAHSIDERKANEAHQQFLMREITHRSKNLLAIVQSMASQTARSAESLDDFRTRFTHRLRGLAASHDLLVSQNWSGAPLSQLIRGQIDTFIDEASSSSLAVAGPEAFVSTRAAQAIGLALHELATNSLKYGALSLPAGRVNVHWLIENDDRPDKRMILTWEESNGPPVQPPLRRGFGTFVIEQMAAQSVEGEVKLVYRPEGLSWTIIVPGDHIVSNDPTSRRHMFETGGDLKSRP